MTLIINHRVNDLKKLEGTKKYFGVEVDLRTFNKEIILNHEPFLNGLNFEIFIKKFNHQFLILNIKEEGIEKKVINILNKFKIKNYFLLDSTIPMSLKLTKKINKCLRISDLEDLNIKSKKISHFNWVWIDYINNIYSIDKIKINILKKTKIRSCFVSPELVNKNNDPKKLKLFLKKNKIIPDAICTKNPEYWKKTFNIF